MDRNTSRTFTDLIVWKKAHALVLAVYRLTNEFPKTEMYGLTSQLRRSVVSVPANIVEGFRKRGRADKLRFYNIAEGSLEETRYYRILAQGLSYGHTAELHDNLSEVSRLLEAYSHAISSES